tara:strand:+ start:1652 stop:1822 length:171 start_codon:yes stop_codon:yes gene_type:complete
VEDFGAGLAALVDSVQHSGISGESASRCRDANKRRAALGGKLPAVSQLQVSRKFDG